MKIYLPPLSVVFVWHPADEIEAFPIVEHCFSLLSRDIKKPYSRSMNLPIFFRTSSSKNVPAKIEIKASKTMVFIFIGKELVADDDWVDYIKAINQTENFITIPIAMDKFAFGLKNIFSTKNFIRTYEFNCLYKKEYMFISITHEIYRWALNEFNSDAGLGKDYALKIFLSHTKDGENGIHIAEALKKFTDNSQIRSFFDATDIAVGYKFDNEIMKHLE